ncbi:MAG: hypothetical protein IKE66_08800 [Hyphomicrobium sp.]|nr:hypothetical protein [Hyphomicrobium sp.]
MNETLFQLCDPSTSHRLLGGAMRQMVHAIIAALAVVIVLPQTALAQDAAQEALQDMMGGPGWDTGVEVKKTPGAAKPSNTTVIERDGKSAAVGGGQLKLVALLTADGQQIDQGLVWRVYQESSEPQAKAKLIAEKREAAPVLKLPPGDYTVNASFGRAHITRKVTLKPDAPSLEQFVLNAGGLRVTALVGGHKAPDGMVTYALFSDDRDQSENRTPVMSGAKPNLIMRLNAGIYRLVSTYGDANARIEADVTVEAGKLTEASITHAAGKATFRLVTRAGGEALPDTHWTVYAANGDVVKDSVGALPTHVLAPGSYTVVAKWSGLSFKRAFQVTDGATATVEVVKEGAGAAAADDGDSTGGISADDLAPSLKIKNP